MLITRLSRCGGQLKIFSGNLTALRSGAKLQPSTSIRTSAPQSSNKIATGPIESLIRPQKPLVIGSDSQQRAVKLWLFGCGAIVFTTVILGGVTRLTESGLSIVKWKFLRERPPLSQEQWEKEFKTYQNYPEYKYIVGHRDMTLEEFKRIWWMEYAHRTVARMTGAAFLLPAAYFWIRGRFSFGMKIRVLAMAGLLVSQGLLGWYMVKSGLEHNRFIANSNAAKGPMGDTNNKSDGALAVDDQTKPQFVAKPSVSAYRLASHLALAFLLYSECMYTAWSIKPRIPEMINVMHLGSQLRDGTLRHIRLLRRFAYFAKTTIFVIVLSGAFVAGLDAGLIYNTFPKMSGRWIPSDYFASTIAPRWRNLFENPSAAQCNHRYLAESLILAIAAMWFYQRYRSPLYLGRLRFAMDALALAALAQGTLGVLTLLHHVPVPLGSAHQTGALVTLTTALYLSHSFKYLPK